MEAIASLQPTEGGHRSNEDVEDVYSMQQICAYEVAYRNFSPRCDIPWADGHVEGCRTRQLQILRSVHRVWRGRLQLRVGTRSFLGDVL